MNKEFKSLTEDFEKAISRVILFSLAELPFSIGTKRFISVLKGTKSSFAIENELHKVSAFSIFSSFTAEYLKLIIDKLIEKELVEVNNVSKYSNIPVLAITDKGQEFLSGEVDIDIPYVEESLDQEIQELTEAEKLLFDQLKELRKQIALENEVPAYVICSDQVLRAIVMNKPHHVEDLLSINGVGEKFTHKYGAEFLKVVRETAVDLPL